MEYTHKPSGRIVVGVVALLVVGVVLWVVSSLFFKYFIFV